MNLDLIEKMNLSEGLKENLLALYQSDEKQIKKLTDQCKKSETFSCLRWKSDIMRLAVCMEYAEYTKEEYLEKGIPLSVFYDTMADIKIWCENNHNKGLKNYRWIENHLNCNLFRIGRLQFQMFRCKLKTLRYDRLPFDYNEQMIYIHIPQGEKLIYHACMESINQAKNFFDKYFNIINGVITKADEETKTLKIFISGKDIHETTEIRETIYDENLIYLCHCEINKLNNSIKHTCSTCDSFCCGGLCDEKAKTCSKWTHDFVQETNKALKKVIEI